MHLNESGNRSHRRVPAVASRGHGRVCQFVRFQKSASLPRCGVIWSSMAARVRQNHPARIQLQESRTGLAPSVVVAPLRCRGAVRIVAAASGTVLVTLAGAERTVGHQTATGAGAGRSRHRASPSGRAARRGRSRDQDRPRGCPAVARPWRPCPRASPLPGAGLGQLGPQAR